MVPYELEKTFPSFNFIYRKLIRFIIFLLFSIFVVLIFSACNQQNQKNIISGTNLIESQNNKASLGVFQQWEEKNQAQGGPNSFVTLTYDKCIPVSQCKFEDCDVEGSRDGKGNFCLPVGYSTIGDWMPDMSVNVLGVSLLDNPEVYSVPIEHTQASARLVDANNNAYFMFTNSQNYYGYIWVVEVQGVDPERPQHLTSNMPAKVVWWQKLNKCRSVVQCNDQYNPGNFNHPARISTVGNLVVIAFQNYSYTFKGKVNLSQISSVFEDASIPVPKPLEISTLPIYPKIRSADAIAFYDVSIPSKPTFVRKLVGDDATLWGGNPPGRDISEVAIAKAGNYYHMNVGGTIYNYNGKGENKLFGADYRITLPYKSQTITALSGDISANIFANIADAGDSYPVSVRLNSVPVYYKASGVLKYGLTLQLITKQLTYNNSNYRLNETTRSTFLENESVLSANMFYGEITHSSKFSQLLQTHILADLKWKSEACDRAWGFQVLENGGYNVICHDANPEDAVGSSQGRFLVRGVSPGGDLNAQHRVL